MFNQASLLLDVRRNTFYLAVVCIYVFTITVFLTSNTARDSISAEQRLLSIALMSLCGLGLWLCQLQLTWAINSFLVGLWLCAVYATQHLSYASSAYFFAIIVLLASNLTHVLIQLVIAIASTALLSFYPPVTGSDVSGPVLFIWVSLVFSYVASRGLVQALETSLHYQRYAVEQMERARKQRFEMAIMTEALQASEESLHQLNVRFRHARDSAEEARRLKAQFAANVSHELRTPINLIVGFSEMIATAPEAYGERLPAAYRADIQAIYRNARHLQGMINDILDISQIEAAQLAIIKEETELRQVIDEAVHIATSLIEDKRLKFHLQIPDELPTLQIDHARIRQVIVNLLVNAVRFTDTGTITLEVTLDEQNLIVRVIDTGIGIPADQLTQVFEEFYQVDGNFARKRGGTGLGLALSKQFVILHSGKMWAESEGIAGQGSTFTFTLPLTGTSYIPTQKTVPVAEKTDFVRHLIVWDDDPAVVQLFRGYTRKHHVLGTSQRTDVLDWLKHFRPVAILVDAEIDTTNLEQQIAQVSPATALIKCPMPSGRRALQAIGLADYLVKPVARDVLLEALDNLGEHVHDLVLIDDEHDMLRMLSRFLQSTQRSFDLRSALNAMDGLKIMDQQPPDAVILDIQLPDFDGFSVLEHMKAQPTLCNIPVIVVSGQGPDNAIQPLANGVITLAKWPGFQPIELVKCVEALAGQLLIPTGPEFAATPPDPAVS